jgi:hypothetical protein
MFKTFEIRVYLSVYLYTIKSRQQQKQKKINKNISFFLKEAELMN